jgi:Ca2+-binding EF-hand superfamily protein
MMKAVALLMGIGLAGALATPVAFAAKGNKPEKTEKKQTLLERYDANKNGKLDADELAAVRRDFASGKPKALKKLDSNADGKLDDAEIEAGVAGKKKKKQA